VPIFDPDDTYSVDAATLYHLRDLLAEVEAFQELCEVADKTAALTKIVYGPHAEPIGDYYTAEELETVFCEAHIHPPTEAESSAVLDEASPTAIVGGMFELDIRRHARKSEIATPALRANLYLWFYDCCQGIANALIESYATRECPRINRIERVVEAAWCSYEERPTQSDYLWCRMKVFWGDLELE
jgi:hypothetical protein